MPGLVAQSVNESRGCHVGDQSRSRREFFIGCARCGATTVSGQETTFIALGSDADEVVGHGSDTYFDATTADFFVNHTSGVHRHFISIIIRPKDGTPAWSMAFTTPEHPAREPGTMRQRRRDTRPRRSA